MANAITTTSTATLELQAERTWDYLTGGDYTAIFQWLEEIPWVRIYTIVIQAAMAFITFFYVAGYIAGRAARVIYDAIRAALPVVVSWLTQQRDRALALRQQLAGATEADTSDARADELLARLANGEIINHPTTTTVTALREYIGHVMNGGAPNTVEAVDPGDSVFVDECEGDF